jgi:hypothetical protein
VAILPMRVNIDARPGLVMLTANHRLPLRPLAVMRIRTSFGPGLGRGTSRTSHFPLTAGVTAAFTSFSFNVPGSLSPDGAVLCGAADPGGASAPQAAGVAAPHLGERSRRAPHARGPGRDRRAPLSCRWVC